MSIKNDILNNFQSQLEGMNLFTKVERGLKSLEDVNKAQLPMCVFNSTKVDKINATYNRTDYKMLIELYVIGKSSQKDVYFQDMDNFENELLDKFNCIDPSKIQASCINISVDSIKELINDLYLDNKYVLAFLISITFRG